MQVFYVNIGGGEPTVRTRLLGAASTTRPRTTSGVKFSTNGVADHARGRARGWRPATTSTCRSRSTARPPTVNDARARAGLVTRRRSRAMERLAEAGFDAASRCRSSSRARTPASSTTFKAIADRYGAQLRLTRLRPSGRGADVWDELHPTAAQQRELYDWLLAHGEEVLDRRLVLPPVRLRRGAARAEPVRRRPRRVPDRSGRRRLRVPVRDPRRVPRRQRPRAGRLRAACGASRSCSSSCGGRRPAAPARSLRLLRRLPRRLHGGEVLHRPAARRPRPRVRARPRRGAAGRARRQPRRRRRRSTTRARRPPDARRATRTRSPSFCDAAGAAGGGRGTADWFESVAEAQRRAKKRLPRSVYSALLAGAERGVDARRQHRRVRRARASCRAIATGLPARARAGDDGAGPGRSRCRCSISPTGVQAVHPDGEVAVARAAAARGHRDRASARSPASRSRRSSRPTRRRSSRCTGSGRASGSLQLLERARAAGAKGLIVTLDWTFSHRRDWGSPAIPERLDLEAMARLAPEALARPRWLLRAARAAGGPPDLTVPNLARAGRAGADVLRRLRRVDADAAADLGRTSPGCASSGAGRSCSRASCTPTTPGARSTIGADAISVSNHGGNNLDGTPGVDPRAAGDRRGGRRPDRGPARRRHPPRQRRRQGARARRPRGDDRPRLPVGPGGQRRGRRRRTCSRSCAAASTRRCSGSAAPRSTSSARTT